MASPASRFNDSYYMTNTFLLLAYLPIHTYFRVLTPDGSDHSRLHSLHELAAWEKQVLTSYLLILAWQFMRRRSWDHLAQNAFFYGKLMTALTAYSVDTRLLVWYILLCWVVIAVCPQPMYPFNAGLDREVVSELSPLTLKDYVLSGSDTSWLVFYYAAQHSESTAMAPGFAELAEKLSSPKLRFASMDATLWPNITRDQRLLPSTWSTQLPAVVLYTKGKEVARLPRQEDVDEYGLKRNYYTKADLVKKLNLDRFSGTQATGVAGQQQQPSKGQPKAGSVKS